MYSLPGIDPAKILDPFKITQNVGPRLHLDSSSNVYNHLCRCCIERSSSITGCKSLALTLTECAQGFNPVDNFHENLSEVVHDVSFE